MKRFFSTILSAAILFSLPALPAHAEESLPPGAGFTGNAASDNIIPPELSDGHNNAVTRARLGAIACITLTNRTGETAVASLIKLIAASGSFKTREREDSFSDFDTSDVPLAPVPGKEELLRQYALKVIELVNAERAEAGLHPLTETEALKNASAVRAAELETLFSHTRPAGSAFVTVLDDFNAAVLPAAENIGAGHESSDQIVTAWMNREGHRNNILNPDYYLVGAGVHSDRAGRLYWELLFTA